MAKEQIVYTRLIQLCDLILLEFGNKGAETLTREDVIRVTQATAYEIFCCQNYMAELGYIDLTMDMEPGIKPLGEFFIANGGFKKKLESEWKQDRFIEEQHSFNKWIVIATIVTALATIWQAFGQDIRGLVQKSHKASVERRLPETTNPKSLKSDSFSLK